MPKRLRCCRCGTVRPTTDLLTSRFTGTSTCFRTAHKAECDQLAETHARAVDETVERTLAAAKGRA